MSGSAGPGLLLPEEIGPADAARVLAHVNAAADAAVLAETVGFLEGRETGLRIAEAILARRAEAGPFASLDALLAVTGVNLARFTEIVTALSGARPGRAAGGVLRLLPASPAPWLGQSVAVMGQLLDAAGRGVPGAPVTCVASAGVLTARIGTEVQRGSSVVVATEPGGIVRFAWEPEILPPLDPDAAAALRAELSQIDPSSGTIGAAGKALAGFAAAYRSPGAVALRSAVDTLAAAMPAEPASPFSAWPLMPVTLIALAGPEGHAETVAVAVLRVRNWLGGFLAELEAAIAGDARMGDALRTFDVRTETGEMLARGIAGVAEGYAGLERGAIGERIRDRVSGRSIETYVGSVVERVEPAVLVDVVRASGASSAAIAGGGFAVYEAIRTVQDVQDTIGNRGVLDGRLGRLEGRFDALEVRAVDRTAFDSLAAEVAATDARSRALDTRIGRVEAVQGPTRADLAALETRLAERFRADLASAVGGVRTDLGAQIGGTRTELGALRTELGTVRRDLTARIDTKADAGTVTTDIGGLRQSVDALRAENRQLGTRLEGVDTRLSTRISEVDTRVNRIGATRPRGPGG